MRTYIHNSWVWTGGERREEGLKQCLHGVICAHQGILLSYYWILLHGVLTVKKTLESGKRRQHTEKTPSRFYMLCPLKCDWWQTVCWGSVVWWWTGWLDGRGWIELCEHTRSKLLHHVEVMASVTRYYVHHTQMIWDRLLFGLSVIIFMYFDPQIIGSMLHQLFINIKSLHHVEHSFFLDEIRYGPPNTVNSYSISQQ